MQMENGKWEMGNRKSKIENRKKDSSPLGVLET